MATNTTKSTRSSSSSSLTSCSTDCDGDTAVAQPCYSEEVEVHIEVRFSNVSIREFEIIIGDNPASLSGPPLSLGWGHCDLEPVSVLDYESSRSPASKSLRSGMSAMKRMERLRAFGHSKKEIKAGTRKANITRNQRMRTRVALAKHFLMLFDDFACSCVLESMMIDLWHSARKLPRCLTTRKKKQGIDEHGRPKTSSIGPLIRNKIAANIFIRRKLLEKEIALLRLACQQGSSRTDYHSIAAVAGNPPRIHHRERVQDPEGLQTHVSAEICKTLSAKTTWVLGAYPEFPGTIPDVHEDGMRQGFYLEHGPVDLPVVSENVELSKAVHGANPAMTQLLVSN